MNDESDQNAVPSDKAPGWADLWQSFSDSSKQMAEAWSSSMAPFMLARLLEHPQGFAAGNEMSEAIEKMAQGPRLADVWDIDRKMALVFGAWMDMRQKLASYNAVTAAPWTEAAKRFMQAMSAVTDNGNKPPPDWREAFAKWSEISNEELIRNQRSDGFLRAQKELLQSGLKLRGRQDDVGEAAAAMFGMPGRKDFDEVTRQLTELQREVRALSHQVNAQQRGHARPVRELATPSQAPRTSRTRSERLVMTEDDRATRFFRDIVANTEKMVKATQLFGQTRDEDVAIGTTPKHLVMRRDKVELFHYEPMAEATARTPVLLAYGLIGRYTMADLQPDRSLVRSLLSKGLDLWLIDWGQPGRTERWLTIDDYVDDYIDAAVDRIAQETGHDRVTLLGICEGGVFTTCYAALHPEKVKNLVITITPIDFHADVKDKAAHHGFLNIWTRSLDPEDIDNLVNTYGVVPGEFMSSVFSMMTPMRSLTKYNVDLIDVVDDEAKFMNFLRMEKWLADRPHHPGEAAKQWLKELYQENRLANGNFVLSGRTVDLKSITAPVLNVFALDDHIIPPDCSRALGAKIGSQDYTEIPLPGGHVGLFVSSKSQGKLSQSITDWLVARDADPVGEA